MTFASDFENLTGNQPFPWQEALFASFVAGFGCRLSLDIPTGLGKTSIMAAWLVARASGAQVPRRLVYIVDRRAVVDQATHEAEELCKRLASNSVMMSNLGLDAGQELPISTLRGQYVDNRKWLEDPTIPAIVVGTVDMIGSRLLFEGYGVSRKMRPYHAGFLGCDSLFVLDEAHLVPPFEMLLKKIASDSSGFSGKNSRAGILPPFRLLSLSATGRNSDDMVLRLSDKDLNHPVAKKRLEAIKRITLRKLVGETSLSEQLAIEAWNLSDQGKKIQRIIIFSNSRDDAEVAKDAIEKLAKGGNKQSIDPIKIETQLFVGARRVHEREATAGWLATHGFLAKTAHTPDQPSFIFATSAGEVGVDMDADQMVCDLVQWERMVQRLGRVNRRGNGAADVIVVVDSPQPDKKIQEAIAKSENDRTKAEQKRVDDFATLEEQREILFRPIMALPNRNGVYDGSPGAIRNLKIQSESDERTAEILKAATSESPLRPELTQAIVDAWSMTSLEEHTGRPLVAPWLRGWIKEDPQTTVVWRRHLPVCDGPETKKERLANATKFFEEAPPHLSETLDTESYRVLALLIKRASRLLKPETKKQSKQSEETPEVRRLSSDQVIGMILGQDFRVKRLLALNDFVFDGNNKKLETQRKEQLQRDLYENTLVLDSRIGGLSETGLVGEDADAVVLTADVDEAWSRKAGFRVRESADGERSRDFEWKTCFRFVSKRSGEGDPEAYLVVDEFRDASSSEDGKSVSSTFLELDIHQAWAREESVRMSKRLELPEDLSKVLGIAARLHDEGKRSKLWQRAFNPGRDDNDDKIYAKTPGPVRFELLDGYRHEFGSLPYVERDVEFQQLSPELQELCLHLVAAHHGFARPNIRITGCDDSPPSALESRACDVALRFAKLQRQWGPWGLAWWESLLRACDQRASRDTKGQERTRSNG